ncbi:unnamed protein product [Phytophthora fragariaefolia]|uniref:Unnamed protein product n=1 Tax=Phytophthora fragariaefolia TaxID=1490495 RepID=A0A9W6XR53_9STRA|nr:unnamed protein product [Phytophthora fragariaefolia]
MSCFSWMSMISANCGKWGLQQRHSHASVSVVSLARVPVEACTAGEVGRDDRREHVHGHVPQQQRREQQVPVPAQRDHLPGGLAVHALLLRGVLVLARRHDDLEPDEVQRHEAEPEAGEHGRQRQQQHERAHLQRDVFAAELRVPRVAPEAAAVRRRFLQPRGRKRRQVERELADTTFLCADSEPQLQRSIRVLTTPQEAQQILSSMIYQPDENYHSSWFGVTDPWCAAGSDGNEIVRMKLLPVDADVLRASKDARIYCELVDDSTSASEASTHEKKISVRSVNDPPTVSRDDNPTLLLQSVDSCVGLSKFELGDVEAMAVESNHRNLVPILTLQLDAKFGTLRVDRRAAVQSRIHVDGNSANRVEDTTMAWKLPDLTDTSLLLKGGISDLNKFLPAVEYCSSPDHSTDLLLVTLSDNGFCGSSIEQSHSTTLKVPVNDIPNNLMELPLSKSIAAVSTVDILTEKETQVSTHTLPMSLETGYTSTLLAFGETSFRLSGKRDKLGIQLPVSFLQTELNQIVMIDDIGFQGYAPQVNFSVHTTKGTISLLPKQSRQTDLSKPPLDLKSSLHVSGSFSALEDMFRKSHLIYTPNPDASGYDKLVLLLESVDDQTNEVLPIVINSPIKPPVLVIPLVSISAFENDHISVAGVTVNLEETQEQHFVANGVTVSIKAKHGDLVLDSDGLSNYYQYSKFIEIGGDAENVNAALTSLQYRSPAQANVTDDRIIFSVTWTDKSVEQKAPATYVLPVKIVKRPLRIKVFLDGSIAGDGSGKWNLCDESISTVDIADACSVVINLTLNAEHAQILNQSSERNEKDDPMSPAQFSGSVLQANRYLRQQQYVPESTYQGADKIVIAIKPGVLPTEGPETVLEDIVVIPVYVLPNCERPNLYWPDTGVSTKSWSNSNRTPFGLPEVLLTRKGLEKGYCQDDITLRITVQASQGFFTTSDTNLDERRALIFEGRIQSLNLALKSVKYRFEFEHNSPFPIASIVNIRVYTAQEREICSAVLQLTFIDNANPRDLLIREAIATYEDTDTILGGELNLSAFSALKGKTSISITAHNGVVYPSCDAVQLAASRNLQISTNDTHLLYLVMSSLHYLPNPDFNGIDEIDFNIQNQTTTLFVNVQAENDPPNIRFVSEDEMKDWYKYPRMFLPSFQLDDPDEKQLLQVDIHAINGTISVEQLSTSAFDGVSIESNSPLSSLRLISDLAHLNSLFLQRLVEIVPEICSKKATSIICAAVIELCVSDGSVKHCEELYLPEHALFYHVTVISGAKNLSVIGGSSFSMSDIFEIHQKFDAVHEVLLRGYVSSGFFRVTNPSCGELRASITPDASQSAGLLELPQVAFAADSTCLNKVLPTIQVQTSYDSNATVIVQVDILTENMRLLAHGSASVSVTVKTASVQIHAVLANGDSPWLTRRDNYINLTSLLNISIVADSDSIADTDVLELSITCQDCQWKYLSFVPRVSYEHAQIPNSRLRFLGSHDSLINVIETLKLAITNASAGEDVIYFRLAPALPLLRRWDSNATTNISIPYIFHSSYLRWEAQQTLIFVQKSSDTINLSGVNLTGNDGNPSLNLTIRINCAVGQATVSLPRAEVSEVHCSPREPAIRFTVQISNVKDVLSSTSVRVLLSEREPQVRLHLIGAETALGDIAEEAFIDLDIIALPQVSDAKFALRNTTSMIQVAEEKTKSIGDMLAITGNQEDPTWYRMQVRVTHGRLFVPLDVCCVDIRETNYENELDVVGSALALQSALAAVQFQSRKPNAGKDLLKIMITCFPSKPCQTNQSFSLPIDIIPANRTRADVIVTSVNEKETQVGKEVMIIPSWSQQPDIDALTSDDAVIDLPGTVDYKTPQTHSIGTRNEFFIAPLTAALVPLIHIEGSIEGPLSSQNWETITLALKVGRSSNVSGIYIRDSSGDSQVNDDDLTLEICANVGTILLTTSDGLEISKGIEYTFTKAITAVGNLERLNDALLTLHYQCSENCNDHDMITFEVSNPLAPPPKISHQRTIKIDQVYEVPVPRVITNASLYYSEEDTTFQFPNLALRCSDNNYCLQTYQLAVRVSYGAVYLVSTDSSQSEENNARESATSDLKLEGTVVSLEQNLDRMMYLPPQNWNEEQFPGGHIVEWEFVVSYKDKLVKTFADLVITPRIDIPVISVPQAIVDPTHYMSDYLSVLRLQCVPLICDEDTPMLLEGFSVRTADATQTQLSTADELMISLSVSNGVISLGDTLHTNCISQFVGPQSWQRISFQASATCMNRVLPGMTYVGEPNFSGDDKLKIRLEDVHKTDVVFDEVSVPIIVVELNDAPYVDTRSVFYESIEDIPLLIENLRLRDPDAFDEPLRVVMETSCGQLALLRPTGINVTVETKVGSNMVATRLTLEGSLLNLNAAIASIVYTSAADWNSLQFHSEGGLNGFDLITIKSSDLSSFNGSSLSVIFIYVEPDVDPVVINIPSNAATSIYANDRPGTLRGDEDTTIEVRDLEFYSVDDTSQMTLVISLSAGHGLLSVSQLGGITFLEGTTDKAKTVKVKGTLANVNSCVAALRYTPDENFYGSDLLVVTADAIDQYTLQHTPSSSINVTITVDPVNDPPLWNIGSSATRKLQQNRSIGLAGVHFRDVDIALLDCTVQSCIVDLIIETRHGFITISDQSPPSFSNNMATNKVAYIVISGLPDELNAILSTTIFELAEQAHNTADMLGRVRLTIDDRGAFGRGGPQMSTTTVVFNPVI